MPYNTENIGSRTFNINNPQGTPTKAFIFNHGITGNGTYVAGGDIPIKHIHGINDTIVPVVGQTYNVADHLKKFINAGNFVKGELLPTDHNLANLNSDNFVIDTMEDVMGL